MVVVVIMRHAPGSRGVQREQPYIRRQYLAHGIGEGHCQLDRESVQGARGRHDNGGSPGRGE